MIDLSKDPDYQNRKLKPDSEARPYFQDTFSHLHVVIPKTAHEHVLDMARMSRITLKSYLAQFLMTAQPIPILPQPVPPNEANTYMNTNTQAPNQAGNTNTHERANQDQ